MAIKAKLNDDQKEAFKALQKFVDHPAADTFVLKGYAGTGKTYLMQYLAQWLGENDYSFFLLASTGRAAVVLKGKTGLTTKTVHSLLYSFAKVDGAENLRCSQMCKLMTRKQCHLDRASYWTICFLMPKEIR